MPGLMKPAFHARRLLLDQVSEYPVASAWSADGDYLAVATAAGGIHLYSPAQPDRIWHWQAHEAPIQALRWHPREPLLSSAAQDGIIKYWRLAADGDVFVEKALTVTDGWIEDMAWRPDGRYLAVAAGRKALVLDRLGKVRNTVDFAASTIAALAWSPRGTELALAGYGGVLLVKNVTERPSQSRLECAGSLLSCLWSPDSQVLTACRQDNAVHFWRVKSRREATMTGYATKPRAMAFSADSRHLVVGGGENLTTWEFSATSPEGSAPVDLPYHRNLATCVCLSQSNGHLAAGDKDGVVSLWEGPLATQPYYHFALTDSLVALHWQEREGRQLLTAIDRAGSVGLWDIHLA
jgi:WD40 repeat protein